MIAYKATTNGKCISITYEVGNTYTFNGKLKMYKSGFHFYKDLYDIYSYYNNDKETRIFEIEVLGKVITKDDKSVTNKFKVLKEISLNGMTLEKNGYKKAYDKNNNLIRDEDSNGFWKELKYDKNNNLIKSKNSNGLWEKSLYDENNNLIKNEDSNGINYLITIEG